MDKTRVVQVVCAADGSRTPHDGRYVVAWNPHTEAGVLELTSTAEIADATRFTFEEAMATWRTVSVVQKKRPWDGKPNRPLTGVHVQIINTGS